MTNSDRPADHAVPRSVGRVLDLLEAVLDSGGCTLSAAASAARLTPTTALRHLRALETRGYVERDSAGMFTVGPTMVRLSAALGDADPVRRLVTAAQPHLETLAAETGESSYLALSDGHVATYVAAAESSRAIRHVGWIGQQVPLDATAVGEALRSPGRCVTRTGAVEPDITAISIGVPVPGRAGVAISIIGPAHRFTERARRRHAAALRRIADDLADLIAEFAAADESDATAVMG